MADTAPFQEEYMAIQGIRQEVAKVVRASPMAQPLGLEWQRADTALLMAAAMVENLSRAWQVLSEKVEASLQKTLAKEGVTEVGAGEVPASDPPPPIQFPHAANPAPQEQ